MCYSSHSIVNRSNHFDPYANPLRFNAPCGHCLQCENANNSAWFVRCYFEWLETKKNGGITFFYTLTFAEEHFPFYKGVNVFSRRKVQLFMKRLRYYLSRYNKMLKLRYLIVSEYGDKKGRSHHHALFFLSKTMPYAVFYELCLKAWQYGFVSPSKLNHGIIYNYEGIRYVTKYISKGSIWYDKYVPTLLRLLFIRFVRLFHYVTSRYSTYNLDFIDSLRKYTLSELFYIFSDVELEPMNFISTLDFPHDTPDIISLFDRIRSLFLNLCDKFKHHFQFMSPFHFQSTKLGTYLLSPDNSYRLDLLNERVNVSSKNEELEFFPLPRFYKRLLWYDLLENERDGKRTTFVLNEAGVQHKTAKIVAEYNTYVSNYHLLRQTPLDEEMIRYLKSNCPAHLLPFFQSLQSFNDYQHFWKSIDVDVLTLFVYDKLLQNRVVYIDNLRDYISLENLPRLVYDSLTIASGIDIRKLYKDKLTLDNLTNQTYDTHPYFVPYALVLQFLRSVSSITSKRRYVEFHKKELEQRNLKRHLKGFTLIQS